MNGKVRLFKVWTHEHADLWPWTLAARNFEMIAEAGIASLAGQLLKVKAGDEATGMLEEAIEEWLHDVKGESRGETLPVHPSQPGALADPLPAGLLIDADDDAVDLFRPWAERTDALPGPRPASSALDGVVGLDGNPAYVHVLRARAADLRVWGEALDGILGTAHEGPDGLSCWEHTFLLHQDATVLEQSDRLAAKLAARARERALQRDALLAAADAGDRATVAQLLKLRVAPTSEVLERALAHGHQVIAADCLEDADLDTLRTALLSALDNGRSDLAWSLLKRGGARLMKAVAHDVTGAQRFVPLVEHLVALKKKPLGLPHACDWWPVELVERLARVLPDAVPLLERCRAYHAERARQADLQRQLEQAIRSDDLARTTALLAEGARAGSPLSDGRTLPVALAAEVACADLVRTLSLASEHWGHEGGLAFALARGPAILGALLANDYATTVYMRRLLSCSPTQAVADYQLARQGGWLPPVSFLDNFRSKGPAPPIVDAVLRDFPERRALMADELARDALVKAIGPEAVWSLLGPTLSIWWKGRPAAWLTADDVFINSDKDTELIEALCAAGAGEPWRGRDDYRRLPVRRSDPAALRAWFERLRQ